jgi:hypothetical protein
MRTRRVLTPAVLLAALASVGCLESDVLTLVRYDQATDSFHCLQVYTNIRAENAGEAADILPALWKKRDNLIVDPVSIRLFEKTAFERRGRHEYVSLSLGERPDKLQARTTKADLSAVKVLPGEFYLNRHGRLSAYQGAVVPGKVFDQALPEMAAGLAELAAEGAQESVKQARDPKAVRITWDQVREDVLSDIRGKPTPRAGPSVGPFDDASLRALSRAVEDGSVKLSRAGKYLTATFPLSDADSLEVIATAEAVRKAIADLRSQGRRLGASSSFLEAVAGSSLKPVKGTGLEVTVDYPALVRGVWGRGDPDRAPSQGTPDDFGRTISAVKAADIPIRETFDVKKLIAGYTATTADDGFVPLFPADGPPKGWVVTEWNDLAKPAAKGVTWTVKDGVLTPGKLRGTWLVSEKEYADFVLEFEIKLTERGNSGVALRAPMRGDPAFDGMELQVADLRYNTQAKDSELTGGIYRAIAPTKQVYKPTEWNTVRIELKGDRLKATVNGELVQDVDLSKFDQPVKRHDGKDAPPVKDRPRKGHIGFQHLSRNNEPIQIKNARIRELK